MQGERSWAIQALSVVIDPNRGFFICTEQLYWRFFAAPGLLYYRVTSFLDQSSDNATVESSHIYDPFHMPDFRGLPLPAVPLPVWCVSFDENWVCCGYGGSMSFCCILVETALIYGLLRLSISEATFCRGIK